MSPSHPRRNDTHSHPSNQQPKGLTSRKSIKKKKTCKKCNLEITGQFVRALGNAFHVHCFTCHECGTPCLAKFFPHDLNGDTVALCEYDYFKKLDLICFNCKQALRGPYITALGNKYHLEHFRCAVCLKVFESDESYYEHESNIYCHYHYSKLFASHCEGCHSSIVKQFVELYRGGRNQQWHPECYMVHKFWNVCVTADLVGLQNRFHLQNLLVIELPEESIDPKVLLAIEEQIESTVMSCWLTLSGFEENTALCISDMLLHACTGNQESGLVSTGRLILNVEVLFAAIDIIVDLCLQVQEPHQERASSVTSLEQDNSLFQPLRKEPRNISGKIMSYLAILRKSGQINSSGSLSAELLSVITGCAHYLKLLIRIGLNNALKLNKVFGTTAATDQFLMAAKAYESTTDLHSLNIPGNATDACAGCLKSIEKLCIRHGNRRWHLQCFSCAKCHRALSNKSELGVFGWNNAILCRACGGVETFEYISDLSQLIYLLKIALYRSKSVMSDEHGRLPLTAESAQESNYLNTLDDITRLRTKRQSQKLSNSIKQNARKSVIVETPEAVRASEHQTNDEGLVEEADDARVPGQRKLSHMSYVAHDDENFQVKRQEQGLSHKRSLLIRDEPTRALTNSHLDRTSDLLKNEKSLTLDDIPRIVAAEQAREQRPNAFKHHNSLYQRNKPLQPVKTVAAASGTKTPEKQNGGTSPSVNVPEKHEYYSELTKGDHFIMRHIAIEAILELCPDRFNKEELLSHIQTPKKGGGFWDKFKFNNDTKNKAAGVFGVDLRELTKKYGVDSDLGVGPSKLRIPIVVDDVINALRQKDMSVEGIFRLNGNIKKLRELTDQINKNPLRSPDFTGQTAVQLAALMKKWLRDLPNPLLTFHLYELWIASQRESDPVKQKRLLQLTYCLLPRSHRNLVEVLLYFLSWVASFAEIDEETGSKMDIHNLATVISPNILYSKQSTESDAPPLTGETYFLGIEVVNQLIEIHEELCVIPSDIKLFFDKCQFTKDNAVSSKEVMAKIEKTLKENPAPFSNFQRQVSSDTIPTTNTIRRGHLKVHNEHHGETGNV